MVKDFFSFKKKRTWLLVLALVLAIVGHAQYRLVKIDGESMEGSYEDGDVVVVSKLAYKFVAPERGDVIVFWSWAAGDLLIKRVIGLPRDTVEIIDGYIYLNEKKYYDELSHIRIQTLLVDLDGEPRLDWETGDFVYEYLNRSPITLENDEYWVIGDNRGVSWYGIAIEEDILGKVY